MMIKRKSLIFLLADHEENVVFIPIVGFGGIGKTTLAQMAFNDEKVKEHFDLRIWVCVSDVFNVKLVIERIIGGGKPTQSLDMETLKNQVFDKIKGKRYLLVLDDLWNEDREKWLQFNDLIINGDRGSRTIITTQNKVVTEIAGVMQPYELKGLSFLESWDLFQKMAFKQGRAHNEVFEMMGREVTAKCAGVPLAMRTIGSLLYTKRKESEWHSFKDDELSKLDPKINIMETLKLSYNHLPSNLKQCFSYCSLFPKGYKFNVPQLVSYLRAQGYVEDKGLGCFRYLLRRSFFQEEKEDTYGDLVSCKMHDFMHDLAVYIAGEESHLLHNGQTISPKTRHTSFSWRSLGVSPWSKWQIPAQVLQARKVRTFFVQHITPDYTSCNVECHAILNKLRSLRVLILSNCGIRRLPSFIYRLKHLRQLDLSWNMQIKMLPESITRLHNLQVLNLDHCYWLKSLPKDMKKLVNLISLGLEGCDRLEGMPQGIGQLNSLEVLSRFNLSQQRPLLNLTGGLDELHELNNLRGEMKIFNLRYVKHGATECKAAKLKEKAHLRYLRLDWGVHQVEDVSSEEKSLEALEPHVNIKELILYHYIGGRCPRWVSSLVNLVRVEIGYCNKCKYLPRLDGLPSLQYVEVWGLLEMEYIMENIEGAEWNASTIFFPSLKSLHLFYYPKLKGW